MPSPRRAHTFSMPFPLTEMSEEHLLVCCRAGERRAFDTLMAQHQKQIYALCLRRLGDSEDARDATQDVFIRAFCYVKDFRGDCTFYTWLYRIAVTITYDKARRRQRYPVVHSTLNRNDWSFLRPASTSDDPAQMAARRERQEIVHAALDTLPPHYRQVLVLFDIEGFSYEDIALVLELPLGTVKSRLHRARSALREELEPFRELLGM